ncbi:hypothetical protein ACJRO7_035840 [Eucalyptus globulus]|uniref:Isopenicillin N synthase-like Fe(2+) 2OG dioxygenase domain-containing protein n=1 Tax=Eucalyptus globulus TaxID=34317 RepID=A0ABD3JA00_EUCGL
MALSTLAALAEKRTLLEKSVCDEDEHPTVAYNQFSDPVISLARIDEFDGTRGEICRKIVVDHGVDRKMIGEMYCLAREFFILPDEKMLRYDMTGGKKGGFLVSSHLQTNFYDEGREAIQDWRKLKIYLSYPIQSRDYSRWPDKPEGWRLVTEEYSEELMGLCSQAPKKASVEIDQEVAINYYPKCLQPDSTLRLKRHTDTGIVTLLLKMWIPTVQPMEGVFVNPTPEATVDTLRIREGEKPALEKPITFDIELPRLKKPAKELQLNDLDKAESESKPSEKLLA